ncbi:MAG: hypothetical protein IH972_05725 [Candidatus Marinimicrobia bacterium]|nr:hypothetical protein [Candidatus Neomarinimicrobiota bacterium]
MVQHWIPIVAIVLSMGGTFTVIIFALYYNYLKRQSQSREILAAIEKGIEVPFPPPRKYNRRSQGIFWIAIGLALTVALGVSTGNWRVAVWGLLPLAAGVASLLISRSEKSDDS